jgi:acetyltransferase-like isoleucine patch superfamily enzyme
MALSLLNGGDKSLMEPLTCKREVLEIQVGGGTLRSLLEARLAACAKSKDSFTVLSKLWPSLELAEALASANGAAVVRSADGEALAWTGSSESAPAGAKDIALDAKSKLVVYPWDILAVNEEVVGAISEDDIRGTVRERVTVDGHLVLGEGSVVLPGVYIEGNLIVGRNTKLGPNCYVRGSTYIADNCHVGQAVEIKNSILMDKVSAGHLSYLGDTIVCPRTNFGAGTITSNFRHDGKNHRCMVGGSLLDTGRRKFGAIIGDFVHTGVHTSIFPGRKIWPEVWTLPGEVVHHISK